MNENSNKTQNEKVVGVSITLSPQTKLIESTVNVISSQNFKSNYNSEKISTQSLGSQFMTQKAYGVSSNQSSLTIQTWSGGLGSLSAFDSSWNQFSADSGGLQIALVNITSNTKKVWTLPNNNKIGQYGYRADVDSNENLYFGESDSNGNNRRLARLNPSTNVFTDYNQNDILVGIIKIDSSDNVFYSSIWDNSIKKLVPSANSITTWSSGLFGNLEDIDIDSSDNAYVTTNGGKTVVRLNTVNNTITTWTITGSPAAVTSDSSGNIFFTETDGIRGKIGRITVANNTLTEWIIPNSSTGTISEISIDSSGNVFFANNGLTRFVPSTGIFTIFDNVACSSLLEIDSLDAIHCSSGSSFSKIT